MDAKTRCKLDVALDEIFKETGEHVVAGAMWVWLGGDKLIAVDSVKGKTIASIKKFIETEIAIMRLGGRDGRR